MDVSHPLQIYKTLCIAHGILKQLIHIAKSLRYSHSSRTPRADLLVDIITSDSRMSKQYPQIWRDAKHKYGNWTATIRWLRLPLIARDWVLAILIYVIHACILRSHRCGFGCFGRSLALLFGGIIPQRGRG